MSNAEEMAAFERYLLDHDIRYHYTMTGSVMFNHNGTQYLVGKHLDGKRIAIYHARTLANDVITDIFGDAE